MRTAKQRMGDPLHGIEEEEFLVVQMADLSEKQRLFVHAYMRTLSGSTAYRMAGYARNSNPATTAAGAVSLLNKPKVRDVVQSLLAARMRRIQATPQRIEEELAKVAFASIGRLMVVQEDGTAFLDFNRADEADLAGLKKFKCEVSYKPGDSRDDPKQVLKMEAEVGDKLAALMGLARIHKMIGGDEGVTALVDIAQAIRDGRKRAGLER
jgi:phage terminase small subunit